MMTRWLVVSATALAACGTSKLPPCDPNKEPTDAWAWAAYKNAGGDYGSRESIGLSQDERNPGIHRLLYEEGVHGAQGTLGLIWKCRFYRRDEDLATALLLERGWRTANAAKRSELATTIDEQLFGGVVNKQPDQWRADRAFKPPETTALPGGGVKRTRWVVVDVPIYGGSYPHYELADVTFSTDARVTFGKGRDGFDIEKGSDLGLANVPPCDPTKPVTQQQAFDVYNKTRSTPAKEADFTCRALELEGLYHLEQGSTSLGYLWRCTLYADQPAVVKQILMDLGWKDADATKRQELAKTVDEKVLVSVVHTATQHFGDKHPFTAPISKPLPDGSIERSRWSSKTYYGPPTYSLDTITFAADGTYKVMHLNSFDGH